MSSNFRQLKVRTKTHISPLVWAIFVSSVILFIGSTFLSTSTSTGPVLTVQEFQTKTSED